MVTPRVSQEVLRDPLRVSGRSSILIFQDPGYEVKLVSLKFKLNVESKLLF